MLADKHSLEKSGRAKHTGNGNKKKKKNVESWAEDPVENPWSSGSICGNESCSITIIIKEPEI